MLDTIRDDDVSKKGPDFATSGGRVKPVDVIRDELARVVRDQKIGPFGPNSLAILVNGGVSALTGREADAIADAILSSSVVARIRAEAVRDAADQMPWKVDLPGGGVSLDYGNGFERWLRIHANSIDPQPIHKQPGGES